MIKLFRKINDGISRLFHIQHWKVISLYLTVYDVIIVNLSYFLALWLRFDCSYSLMPRHYVEAWFRFVPVYTLFCVIIFRVFRLYSSLWRYASFSELIRVTLATLTASLFHTAAITLFVLRMPLSYYFSGAFLQFGLVLFIRFSYRILLILRNGNTRIKKNSDIGRVMLIGAGSAGETILKDISRPKNKTDKVVCIIDDNNNKWGRYIEGVPIVGGRDDILYNVNKYDINKIFFAIPSATPEDRRDILNICKEAEVEMKVLPGILQLVNGEVTVNSLKEVSVEDLLGRKPVESNLEEVYEYINGKVILVTGGGGSIGSELCRQIAAHSPKKLIIFDIYENNAYGVEQELKRDFPKLDFITLIGSVRDSNKIFRVFEKYKPDVVYHAAAHKHVPLMEGSPCEAIKNNAIGTYKTAYAAMCNGCKRFVLISTDKAVNPTNIMGASKRICEMIVQTFDKMIKEGRAAEIPLLHAHMDDEGGSMERMKHEFVTQPVTEYVAVRFGNVLGSNGSVVPLFKKQIEMGGPVTVTHPDVIRYFMTIPEAVSLVLTSTTYAWGGEIFVLDMGSPVKIDTLARNLIKLSGLKPDVDIMVEYTGLRPGEKLYEEKLMAEEGLKKTKNKLIHIGKTVEFDTDKFIESIKELVKVSYNDDEEGIRPLVKSIVNTYSPAGAHGNSKKDAKYEKLAEELD